MAYSTRRKSVNLSLLGIHVPRPAQRMPPITAAVDDSILPPTKKIKRSHSNATAPESLSSSPKFAVPRPVDVEPSPTVHTPPPSPPPSGGEMEAPAAPPRRVDTEGINDDVVVAVIEQLEKTENRPHLLKELAAAIAGHVQVVETSANQSAIICSRLTNFLKRPWTTLAPCPIGKELVGTHPKRLFFFLTTQPRQAIPDPDAISKQSRIITPSLTSGTSEDEDNSNRRRTEMSPSPELELASPDFVDLDIQLSRSGSFSESIVPPVFSQSRTSPPLERDEHEFTKTATELQQRQAESQLAKEQDSTMKDAPSFEASILFDDMINASQRNKDFVFGQSDGTLSTRKTPLLMSSPMIYPNTDMDIVSSKLVLPPLSLHTGSTEPSFAWTELQSPETVELQELENLFESY